jgi:diaminopimelate decarboxylase
MHDFHYVGKKLFCEGVAVETLAKKFGTPLYIYSQHTLANHFQKLDSALAPLDHLICFAMKSNSNLSVLRTIGNLGGGFDIVSGGELRRVIAAGGDPRKCIFAASKYFWLRWISTKPPRHWRARVDKQYPARHRC